jgi:hypothetical protein
MPPPNAQTGFVGSEDVSGSVLEQEIGKISDGATRTRAEYAKLESGVRRAMLAGGAVGGLAGAAAGYYIYRHLDEIREALNKLLKVAEYVVKNGSPVVSLINHSFDWVTKVKTPASDLQFQVDDLVNYDFALWSGQAAEVYKDKRSKQKDAVGEIVVRAEFISSWLFKIAKANVDYVVELGRALNAILGQVAKAAVNAGTLINLLFAIDDVAEIVGTGVEEALNGLLAIVQRLVASLGDVRDLTTVVGDRSKLPGGKWPEAVRG